MSERAVRAVVVAAFLMGCGAASPAPRTAAPHIEADSGPTGEATVAEAPPAEAPPPEAPPSTEPSPPPGPAPSFAIFDPDAPIVLLPEVEAHVREVARRVPHRRADVFAKIGDSATASRTFMRCFAEDDELDLGGRDELRPVIERIRHARVAGTTSFARDSEAAIVGRSVHTLLRGDPSPVTAEIRALSPRFALVMFGGNDIEIGRLDLFGTSMLELVDHLLARGTIPILSTIPPRDDDAESDAEVPRYIAVIEAIARSRRLPLIDLHRALMALPAHGLASDGVHPNAPVRDGRAYACDFGADGMRFGMNVRNLLNLRMLAHLSEVIADADGEATYTPLASPARVDGQRFATVATTAGGDHAVSAYPGCQATQDESGPERRFALRLDAPAVVRAEVMYEGQVDVDVHLLSAGRCVARGDRSLEATVAPGDYEVVVDTFESDAHAGEFLLLVERGAAPADRVPSAPPP
ncbi:MAG: SGNH/GDSL hydrolase family protein [Myxococcales bacterium]|nr:SGNH/GDSL hydrolase family protein [Myxococcales bacterium]